MRKPLRSSRPERDRTPPRRGFVVMSETITLDQVLQTSEQLSVPDQLRLISLLAQRLRGHMGDGGESVDAIAFNRLPEDLPSDGAARLLYRLAVNRWAGTESCQLVVEQIVS